MSIIFDIINISLEAMNETEKIIIITFVFECPKENLTWKCEKAYDALYLYFSDLINKVPNIVKPPNLFNCNNNIELFKTKFKDYLNECFSRKEILRLFSFQKLFEFPNEILEKQIIIDTISNISEYNIIDYYFINSFLFISCGNSNTLKALSYFFSYFESKGYDILYKLTNKGAYGEKKFILQSKKTNSCYVTKMKHKNNLLFFGYNNGKINVINIGDEKKDPSIFANIDNIESKSSINGNYKISNIFYQEEKGLIFIFVENDSKCSIYEINYNQHIKDMKLTDRYIIHSYINFKLNKIFVIDNYGTLWMYEYIPEIYTTKLLQASYSTLFNIRSFEVYTEKYNEQTINIFLGTDNSVLLYQYSITNNNFNIKLKFNIQFSVKSIKYISNFKCLLIGCSNGTIQIWKSLSKNPEYIIETGYENINKIFYDEKNNYIFVSYNKNIKILEVSLEKILNNDKGEENNKENIIADSLKDKEDDIIENNIKSMMQAFQFQDNIPETIGEKNKENDKDDKNINKDEKKEKKEDDKEIEKDAINVNLNDNGDIINIDDYYKYEVRSVGSLDGWDEI